MQKNSFTQLFDSSNEGVLITNSKNEMVYYNPVLATIFPVLGTRATQSDFERIINLDVELNKEISYDLFELDYYVLVMRSAFEMCENKFNIFRFTKTPKDSFEERLSFFVDNIDEVVYTERISDKHGKQVDFISKAIQTMLGVSAQSLIDENKTPVALAFEADKSRLHDFVAKTNEMQQPGKCQFRILHVTTKKLIWVELSLYPQVAVNGEHFSNFGVLRDISKDIEADQLLRQSELKHRLLFSEANDAIMIFKDLEMVDCNEKTLSMFNSPGFVDIAGKKLYELMPEKQPGGDDSILQYHNFMQKAKKGESQFFYWKHCKLNGEQFDSEVSINSFTVETDAFVQVIVRDITERRLAEEQKNQSIKTYYEVFNSSSDLTFIVNMQGEVIDANKSVLDVYETEKEALIGERLYSLGELQMNNDTDLVSAGKAWNGELQKFQWMCKTKSGKSVLLEMILHPGTYFGKEVIIASGRDISERIAFEKNIKESEAKFRTLATHAPIGIFLTNEKGDAIYVNEQMHKISNFHKLEGFMDDWLNKVHPEDRLRIKQHIKLIQTQNNQHYEYRILVNNSEERWMKAQVNLLRSPVGEVIGRVGTIEDITAEIMAANKLSESERNYRQLVEILPDSIVLHGKKHIEYLNPKAKTFLQIEAFESVSLLASIPDNKREQVADALIDALAGIQSLFFETQIKVNNTVVDIELCAVPFTFNSHAVAKIVIHDITSRKRAEKEKMRAEFAEQTAKRLKKEIDERIAAEKELKSAKEYNQYIINSSLDMIIATDTSGIVTEYNNAAARNFGYFTTSMIGGPVEPLFGNSTDYEHILSAVFLNGTWSGEVLCKRADDSEFTGYLSASLIRSPDKEVIGAMGVLRDITKLKEAEEALKLNVHQKEILLKEVHHRVKNNLQVISSILSLQTAYIQDSGALSVIQECQDRVKSMAYIHESLYQAADLAKVNFSEYLRNLCNNLMYSYSTPNRKVILDFDIADISLSLDAAIPCGLIVNELVSNCFKYAFENQARGVIRIRLAEDDDNLKTLVVQDSGKGLPEDLNIETNDSLGLQLVYTLADQIDGEIKYEFAKGSKFTINFKRN